MHRLPPILLLAAFAMVALGQLPFLLLTTSSVPTTRLIGGSLDENFEATGSGVGGYDLAGWTEAGNAGSITNANATSAPAPLEGAESLELANTGFDQIFTWIDLFPTTATGTNELSGYFRLAWETTQVGTTFFAMGATNSDFQLRLQTVAGGAVKLLIGVDAVTPGYGMTSTATMSAGNTYDVWWNYAKGDTTIDSTGRVWFATNSSVRPTGGDSFVQIINGTNGYNVEQLFVILQNFSQPLAKAVYDKFRVRIGPISTIDAIIP